ncbi:hypothetical protein [Pontibacter populi]|uniref:Macroglobulin domain-containing protein n=1 Tax=Pontibacter populi TaxID=890055 RepID=A0ABV1RUG8_9BACT
MQTNRYTFLQTGFLNKASLLAIVCFVLLAAGSAMAQSTGFKTIGQQFDQHRKKALQEKLYLHIDRPVYACGETMWFKLYNVDGTLHQPLDMSKVAYIEVLDDAKQAVLQAKVALKEGTGNGSFILPATLKSGNYKVRAYTNWMKNFSPEFYFEQPITIVNTFQKLEAPEKTVAAGYTIQFFPEGGNMVAGIENKIAFKAINQKTGKGIDFTGELHDQYGTKIADFKPYKFGMGHFTFTPSKGATYTATVKLAADRGFVKPLPAVFEQGYALNLNEDGAERLKITINQVGQTGEQVYLLGHTRQMIAVAEEATINQGQATFIVDKNVLADGITHFTIFNTQQKPVAERLYFKQPTQKLELKLLPDKSQYTTRDKVTLDLLANADNTASTANLSMAVYRLDSLQGATDSNIESYFWLTSDLKGTIENPAYYFSALGKTDAAAIDNLMLTHGWSRFKWEDIINKEPAAYSYLPEYNGHFIKGKVTHKSTGAPAPGIKTYLGSPGKHIRFYNARSDANGAIQFEAKDFFGEKDIVVQSDFSKDSTFHFEIYSPFSDKYAASKVAAFDLSEELKQEVTLRHVQTQVQQAYFGNYTNLFKPAGVDSISFYGIPSESYLLDDYKRFKVMEEVMREYVPGVQVRKRGGNFRFMVFNRAHKSIFQDNPMVLLDGVPVFDIDKIMAFDPLKVKKLDVVTSLYFNGPLVYNGVVSYTTYTGDLAGFELNPRALLQAYDGLQLQREFYAPAYESPEQKQSRLADLRNLLYWAPDLTIPSGKGKQVNFYTSDQPGTYLIVVQGLTENGVMGSKAVTFSVKQPVL